MTARNQVYHYQLSWHRISSAYRTMSSPTTERLKPFFDDIIKLYFWIQNSTFRSSGGTDNTEWLLAQVWIDLFVSKKVMGVRSKRVLVCGSMTLIQLRFPQIHCRSKTEIYTVATTMCNIDICTPNWGKSDSVILGYGRGRSSIYRIFTSRNHCTLPWRTEQQFDDDYAGQYDGRR